MLSRFGSFFLVFQVKGCKTATLCGRGTEQVGASVETAERRFWDAYPQLNEQTMKERVNGELYLDIAHEILPANAKSSPVVGFWRIEGLLASAYTSGFSKPTIFPYANSRDVGSIQCVMPPARLASSAVVSSQHYQCVYNFARPADNARTRFQLEEGAVSVSDKYEEEVMKLHELYRREIGTSTSYPVRMEFRIGAAALPSYKLCIEDLVRTAFYAHRTY